MYQLDRLYSSEDIPIYNMDLAISSLIEAANKNNSFAQLQLGIIYGVRGLNVTLHLAWIFLTRQSIMETHLPNKF